MSCERLKEYFVRKHKFLLLPESEKPVIWDPFKRRISVPVEIRSDVTTVLMGVDSQYLVFDISDLRGTLLEFEVFDTKKGKAFQLYFIARNVNFSEGFIFAGKSKYLFLRTENSISRITFGDEGLRGEEKKIENMDQIRQIGQVGDKIFALHELKVTIFDPETLLVLRVIPTGGYRALEIPWTSALLIDESTKLDTETGEKICIGEECKYSDSIHFFPDGRVLKNTSTYIPGGKRKECRILKDWKEVSAFNALDAIKCVPYSDEFVLEVTVNGVSVLTTEGEDIAFDFFPGRENDITPWDAIEIPLSKAEMDEDTERFSNLIFSAAPVPRDIARVIGKFI